MKLALLTPGISHRVLEREEKPLAGAFVGFQAEDFLAVEQDAAAGDLVIRVAGDGLGQRAFARAVQAHDGVNLALGHFQVEAFDDGLVVDADAKVFDDERLIHGVWEEGTASAVADRPRTGGRGRAGKIRIG